MFEDEGLLYDISSKLGEDSVAVVLQVNRII
jgi:hypothetical protein